MTCNPQHLKARLDSLLLCIRGQNSGADIHLILNIRHRCEMLIEIIDLGYMPYWEAEEMCLRLEAEVTVYFINKFAHLSNKGPH
jgi:hypothetical protein